MEDEARQHELIESLFIKMGASEKQAQVMTAQLLKRAQQISGERGISLVEAVETLLKRVVEAQNTE